MKECYKAVKITDNVYWVGAIDWSLREFHGYTTERGSTYNAFLIMADKITLIDAVKAPFKEELLSRIASVVNPRDISYIVSNHAEPDHSGALPDIVAEIRPEKVLASNFGAKNLAAHFAIPGGVVPVKDGEKLSLGNMELTFVETRMLHWPDSMFTYLAKDSLLFSNDAFGMHMASSERFDDEIPWDQLERQAAKYYANILLPYSNVVLKLGERLREMNLPIKMIAPDHGPIWRQKPGEIVALYNKWAQQKPTRKAVVVYDTMWESTAAMARSISEGLAAGGADVKHMPLHVNNRSEVVTELLDAGALLVGSPTLNNNILPPVADVLTYLKGLKPKNLIGAAFGSYGWSGESIGQVGDIMKAMGVEMVGEGIKAKFVPDESVLNECYALGLSVAERLAQQ
jgi:flavorubredoxin